MPSVGLASLTRIAVALHVSVQGPVRAYARGEAMAHRELAAFLATPLEECAVGGGSAALGRALRALRLRRMRTQEEVARLAAVAGAHLGDLERGEHPDPRLWTICRLARGLSDDPGDGPSAERAAVFLACVFAGEARLPTRAAAPGGPQVVRTIA